MVGFQENRKNRDGLTPQERAVLDLWDAGHSIQKIQASLNLPRKRVAGTIANLAQTDTDRVDREAIACGSAALANAIDRIYGAPAG